MTQPIHTINGEAQDLFYGVATMNGPQLRKAVEQTHGGTTTFVECVAVREEFQGKTVWEGPVHVFGLAGNPIASRAYAFVVENDAGKRIAAVLHHPPVDSPQAAVRAALVAEQRGKR